MCLHLIISPQNLRVLLRVQDKQHAGSYLRDLHDAADVTWPILSPSCILKLHLIGRRIFSRGRHMLLKCWIRFRSNFQQLSVTEQMEAFSPGTLP